MSKLEKWEVKKTVYGLELNQEELDALYLILRRVGGNPKTSYRKYVEPIYYLTREYTKISDPSPSYFEEGDSLIFKSNMVD